jgi:hypothetical protein
MTNLIWSSIIIAPPFHKPTDVSERVLTKLTVLDTLSYFTALPVANYAVSNARLIDGWWSEKNLIEVIFLYFTESIGEKQ